MLGTTTYLHSTVSRHCQLESLRSNHIDLGRQTPILNRSRRQLLNHGSTLFDLPEEIVDTALKNDLPEKASLWLVVGLYNVNAGFDVEVCSF